MGKWENYSLCDIETWEINHHQLVNVNITYVKQYKLIVPKIFLLVTHLIQDLLKYEILRQSCGVNLFKMTIPLHQCFLSMCVLFFLYRFISNYEVTVLCIYIS